MDVILVAYRYGSSTNPAPPYVAFLPAGLPRDQYLEVRAELERPGYIMTAEEAIFLPDGAVDLQAAYSI